MANIKKKKRSRTKKVQTLIPVEAGTQEEFVHKLNYYSKAGYTLFPDTMKTHFDGHWASFKAIVYKNKFSKVKK